MENKKAAEISAEFPYTLHRVEVLDSHLAYVDTGPSHSEDIVVFLHGNPTSSYLWRNVIPHVSSKARCIAPDLIGMGHSGKLSNSSYRFHDHAKYLRAFIDAVLPSRKFILVLHDWGSALGLDFARQHPDQVHGLVLMEFLRPWPSWEALSPDVNMQELFRAFRAPESGRELLIEQNAFIEVVLSAGTARQLAAEEMTAYRAPFLELDSREPLYRFPNELPIEGKPSDIHTMAEQYHTWLLQTEVPKLFFWARPGGVMSQDQAAWYSENLLNTRSVFVGEGKHYLPEDQPHVIGSEIASWLERQAAELAA